MFSSLKIRSMLTRAADSLMTPNRCVELPSETNWKPSSQLLPKYHFANAWTAPYSSLTRCHCLMIVPY